MVRVLRTQQVRDKTHYYCWDTVRQVELIRSTCRAVVEDMVNQTDLIDYLQENDNDGSISTPGD